MAFVAPAEPQDSLRFKQTLFKVYFYQKPISEISEIFRNFVNLKFKALEKTATREKKCSLLNIEMKKERPLIFLFKICRFQRLKLKSRLR